VFAFCPTDVLSPTNSGLSLVVPHEVRVPDVCCVGLSSSCFFTVSNVAERWLSVCFELSDVNIGQMNGCNSSGGGRSDGGRRIDGQTVAPFAVKRKATIEPRTSEEIKVPSNIFKFIGIIFCG